MGRVLSEQRGLGGGTEAEVVEVEGERGHEGVNFREGVVDGALAMIVVPNCSQVWAKLGDCIPDPAGRLEVLPHCGEVVRELVGGYVEGGRGDEGGGYCGTDWEGGGGIHS